VLTGQPAFGSTWPDVLARLSAGWVPRPSAVVPNLHPALERMTTRALAIDPAERYQDLRALAADLAALRSEIEVEGPPETGSFSGPVLPRIADAVTEPIPAIHAAAAVPDTRPLQAPPSSASAVEGAPAPATVRSTRPWVVGLAVVGLAVAATVAAGLWTWRGAGSRAVVETVAPTTPATATVAEPPPVSEPPPAAAEPERSGDAAAAAAFTSDVWQAVARRDHASAARLLRGRPDLAAGLLGDLAGAARSAATEARRAADARGRTVQDTADYRTALNALARAQRSDASGPTLDGVTATWEAIDAFGRATPPPVAAARPARAPDAAAPPDARPAAPLPAPPAPTSRAVDPPVPLPATRDTTIPAPVPERPVPDPPRPPVGPPPDESPVPVRPAEPPPPAPATAPSKRVPTAEEAVRAALTAYEVAYDAHDVAAIRQVFPAMSAEQAQALTRTFADAVSYRLDLRVIDVTVGPSTATATCVVTHALVPKVGSPSRTTQTSTFQLTPAGERWVIARIAVRP